MEALNKNEIIILYNSVDYFLSEIENRGYVISELYKNESLVSRTLRKVFNKFSINENTLYGKWKNHLKSAKYIVIFATVDIKILQYIKSVNPEIKIIYWYWNPAYRIGRPTPELYQLTDIWTFDKNDAENYNIKYNNTFYFNTINLNNTDVKYDLMFVGRNKHRKEKLIELKEGFEKSGFNSFFHIVPNRNEKNPDNIKELSYSEYLNLIAQSKAILDIMPPSQVGLTLRPMESIFLNKKLVTDNPHIVDEPFYNPNNIFVLGVDHLENLKSFFDTPYEPVNYDILDEYDFDNWLKRIVS